MSSTDPEAPIMVTWKQIYAVMTVVAVVVGGGITLLAWAFDGMRHEVAGIRDDMRVAVDRLSKSSETTNANLTSLSTALAHQEERATALNNNLGTLTTALSGLANSMSNVSKTMGDLDIRFTAATTRQETFQRIVLATMVCDTPLQTTPAGPLPAICTPDARAAAISVWLSGVK